MSANNLECLREEVEGRHGGTSPHEAGAVGTGERVAATGGPRVLPVRSGVSVRDVKEGPALDHASGDPSGELLDLSADVLEESLAGPAADEHDGVGGYVVEVHRHRRSAPQ